MQEKITKYFHVQKPSEVGFKRAGCDVSRKLQGSYSYNWAISIPCILNISLVDFCQSLLFLHGSFSSATSFVPPRAPVLLTQERMQVSEQVAMPEQGEC